MIVKGEPKKTAQKEDIQLISDEIHRLKQAIHSLMNKDTLFTSQAISVQQPSSDPLFEDKLPRHSFVNIIRHEAAHRLIYFWCTTCIDFRHLFSLAFA